MDEAFCIFVDRLRTGREETIHEVFSPNFLDVNDPELLFQGEVKVDGKAYLAGNDLVLHFHIDAEALIPCAICNEPTVVPVKIQELIHVVPPEELSSGIYFFQPFLRDTILLEVPLVVECHEGNCPAREELKQYYHHPDEEGGEETYRPFADLDLGEE